MASKRRLRRKQCTGKMAFDDAVTAGKHAAYRSHICGQYLLAYRCKFCHRWHVGHPPKEVRRALKIQRGIVTS